MTDETACAHCSQPAENDTGVGWLCNECYNATRICGFCDGDGCQRCHGRGETESVAQREAKQAKEEARADRMIEDRQERTREY